MTSRILIGLLIAGFATPAFAQLGRLNEAPPIPAESGDRLLKPIRADIKVAADGRVTAIRLQPGIPDALLEPFERALKTWRFLPAMDKGVAIDWATRVSLWLVAEPVQEGYAFKVHAVDLTTAWYDYDKPFVVPAYPPSMRRKGSVADVLLLLERKPGTSRNKVVSMNVNGESVSSRNPFAEAASKAVRRWPFVMLEWDGKRYVDQFCVPVNFSIDGHQATANSDDASEDECRQMPGSHYEEGDEEIRLAEEIRGRFL